jgi:hypothetical protein
MWKCILIICWLDLVWLRRIKTVWCEAIVIRIHGAPHPMTSITNLFHAQVDFSYLEMHLHLQYYGKWFAQWKCWTFIHEVPFEAARDQHLVLLLMSLNGPHPVHQLLKIYGVSEQTFVTELLSCPHIERLKRSCSCNRWCRPIELWDIKVPTFFGQSAHRWWRGCEPFTPASHYVQEDSWYSFLLEVYLTPGS